MLKSLRNFLIGALHGKPTHVDPVVALESLPAEQACRRPDPDLRSIWEELAHVVYWQDFTLGQLRGENPALPKRASESWLPPPLPEQAAAEWLELTQRFNTGLQALIRIAQTDNLGAQVKAEKAGTVAEEILCIAQHNSYHFGQIVTLRRLLGLWPPPSGGNTW